MVSKALLVQNLFKFHYYYVQDDYTYSHYTDEHSIMNDNNCEWKYSFTLLRNFL